MHRSSRGPGPLTQTRKSPRRSTFRPGLESLEERTLLTTRSIIPLELPSNDTTTFHSVASAMISNQLAAGDVIQIEPGATPGVLFGGSIPSLTNLTIQGNPALGASEYPALILANAVTIGASRAGFTFRNVSVLIDSATLTFTANGNIIDSIVQTRFSDIGIHFNGTTTAKIVNSQFIAFQGGNIVQPLLQVTTAAGASNLIQGNTFDNSLSNTQTPLILYTGVNSISDKILNNTFHKNAGPATILVNAAINGLTIQGNSFSADGMTIGISAVAGVSNLNILNNTIRVPGTGINVSASTGATSVVISDNEIATNNLGTGISLDGSGGATLNAKVQGNNLHNNKLGIRIAVGFTGIDLGGGALGSLGGNNFRSFTAPSDGASGAIVAVGGPNTTTIPAQKNLFGVANPETVIFDKADDGTRADINAANNLTGNAAYVQVLYHDFLHRTGNTGDANDGGFWVNQLNTAAMTPAQVANGFVRSAESLGAFVQTYYLRFLFRAADMGGLNFFVGFLQNNHTLEQVQGMFLDSPEYRLKFGSDGGFAASLYHGLLNRIPAQAELTASSDLVRAQGRLAVANGFLGGVEFRRLQVTGYFLDLLGRATPPTQPEVDNWVNTNQDLLSIMVSFAATTEFQTNG
ncbi:hypothetical protein BH10PLA2_BH10PLA2_27750 [soil metagenome]